MATAPNLSPRFVAVIVFALATLFSTGALAALSDEAAARLFDEGLAAFDGGDPKRAAGLWEKLLAEGDPAKSWRVLYNLGLAYRAAGDRPRAVERFDEFARRVGEQPGSLPIEFEARRQDAVERASKLRPDLSLLRIAPAVSGERVRVRIAGGEPRDAGFSMYLEPGTYALQMGEGTRAITEQVVLARGELQTHVAKQLPPPKPPPPPPYSPPIHPGVLVGGGILAAASIAVPVALLFRARGLREDAAAIPSFDADYPAALERYDDAKTTYFATWSIPATLAAATLTMLVVDLADASSRGSRPAAALVVSATEARLEARFP